MERDAKFIQLYNNIMIKASQELQKRKAKAKKRYIIGIIAACAVTFPSILLFSYIPGLSVFLSVLLIMYIAATTRRLNTNSSYVLWYKNMVVRPIVKSIFKDAQYIPQFGIRPSEYDARMGLYNKSVKKVDNIAQKLEEMDMPVTMREIGENLFLSEDKVVTNDENSLIFSEVRLELTKPSEGIMNFPTYDNFCGVAGNFKSPKNFDNIIRISKDSYSLGANTKMDSEEFERHFNLYTNNSMSAFSLITPDVMLKLIDLKNKLNNNFELVFWKDKVYFRIAFGRIFEIDNNKNEMDISVMQEYYELLCKIKELSQEVVEILNSAV